MDTLHTVNHIIGERDAIHWTPQCRGAASEINQHLLQTLGQLNGWVIKTLQMHNEYLLRDLTLLAALLDNNMDREETASI